MHMEYEVYKQDIKSDSRVGTVHAPSPHTFLRIRVLVSFVDIEWNADIEASM